MSTAAPLQSTAAKSPSVSKASHAGLLLQRKCACGGSASSLLTGECEECKNKRLQKKLSIGASNDPLEQEADRVADQVLAAPAHTLVSSAPLRIQRFTDQSMGQANIAPAPASVDRVLASSGRPLEPALRQDMGNRFGYDFSQVRVHTGAAAEQSARDVSANAYTVGQNIVFGADRFAPETQEGRRLIAHELTHVVQQSKPDPIRASQSDEKRGMSLFPLLFPYSADVRIAQGKPVNISRHAAQGLIQRQLCGGQSLPACPTKYISIPSDSSIGNAVGEWIGLQYRSANRISSYLLVDHRLYYRGQRLSQADLSQRTSLTGKPRLALDPTVYTALQTSEFFDVLRPDILDSDRDHLYEIKPVRGAGAGPAQLNDYIQRLNQFAAMAPAWMGGRARNWQPGPWRPRLQFQVAGGLQQVIVCAYPDSTPGVLLYDILLCPKSKRTPPEPEPPTMVKPLVEPKDLNIPLFVTVAALLGLSTAAAAWPRAKAPTVPTTTPRAPTVSAPQPTQQPQAPSQKPTPSSTATRRPHHRPPRAGAGTKAGAGMRGHRPGTGTRVRPPRVSPRGGGRTGGIRAPSGSGALRVGGGLLTLLSLYGAYKTIQGAKADIDAMRGPYEALWDEFEKQRAAGNRGDDTAAAQPTLAPTPPSPEPEPPRKPPEKETKVRLFEITRSRLSEHEASVPSTSIGISYFPVEFFSLTRTGEHTTEVGAGQIDCSRIHKGIAGVSGYQRYTGYARERDVKALNELLGGQITLARLACALSGRGPQPAVLPDGDEINVALSASGESVAVTCKKLAGASASTCTSEGNFASMKALMDDPELDVPPDFVLEVTVVRTRNGESQHSDRTISVWVENPDHPAPEPSVQADGSVPADASDWKMYPSGSEIAYLLELYSRWGR